ncbi:complement factor H-related protein 2 isoform X3 [Desmodus rotundus]|uniref:complement factor H-related protein 2 isoform X3 n=1 Tax=Desmodus rotundus TaxID=9430 RepID=UPI0023814AE7|nr:complement factor H-related protein 2 isoform X3 [Desmodus rotundus]
MITGRTTVRESALKFRVTPTTLRSRTHNPTEHGWDMHVNTPSGTPNMLLSLITVIVALWASRAHGQGRTCDFPEIKHGNIYEEHKYKQAFPVAVGKYFYYSCDHSFASPSQSLWTRITCTEEGWSPTPKCLNSRTKCGPPPTIDNGDITTLTSVVYAPGESVEYRCQAYYELQGNRIITCHDGKWSEPPKCLEACVISEEMMEKHNIQFRWRSEKRLYSKTDDILEFTCRYGYRPKSPRSAFRVRCREGKLTYPTCE